MLSRWIVPAAAAVLLVVVPRPAPACPFCNLDMGQSLADELKQADLVLFGTLSNAKGDPADPDRGTTDLAIDLAIKPHDAVKDKKAIVLPKYWPSDGKNTKYLIFCNVVNGKLDPYRGVGFPANSKIPDYLKGALDARKKDATERLKFFFDYLESPEIEISNDAYKEFAFADYPEVKAFGAGIKSDAARVKALRGWLKDPNTRAFRYGLYGLLLGHCGAADDAKMLRAMLDDPDGGPISGRDGVLAGYVLLDPKDGWGYVRKLVGDRDKDFNARYAGLRTLRFLWENAQGAVPEDQLLGAMKEMIDQPDLADLPIDDLWKWKRWELTPNVLAYSTKESHTKYPIINRAILRFSIAATIADPKNKAAADYIDAYRKRDPRTVEFQEGQVRDALKSATPAPVKKN